MSWLERAHLVMTKLATYWDIHVAESRHKREETDIAIPYSLERATFKVVFGSQRPRISFVNNGRVFNHNESPAPIYHKVTGRSCVHVLNECLNNQYDPLFTNRQRLFGQNEREGKQPGSRPHDSRLFRTKPETKHCPSRKALFVSSE